MRWRTAILAVVVWLAGAPAWAGWQEGVDAHDKGDYATALREWQPLAEQGDRRAQCMLGVSYDRGIGVPKDSAKALRWYRQAAQQEFVTAQFFLGVMYDEGRGVPRDAEEALRWYRLAAAHGFVKAQSALGRMYTFGDGIPRDWIQAHMWNSLAAAQNEPGSREVIDMMVGHMTPGQIAEAQRLAREWKPKGERAEAQWRQP